MLGGIEYESEWNCRVIGIREENERIGGRVKFK